MAENSISNDHGAAIPPQIGVRDAVRKAAEYLQELYSYIDTTLPNLRLEEVDLSDDGSQWLITFGFTAAETDVESNPLLGALGGTATRTRREYKVIAIDARTGEPLSMKIREL
jgi:hypothetical protein